MDVSTVTITPFQGQLAAFYLVGTISYHIILSEIAKNKAELLNKLVAHRGDQEGLVENTIEAFQQASKAGVMFAECDIQFTKDLVPVVFHDADLKRLCSLDYFISELTWAHISSLELPFQVPRLSELLSWLEHNPATILFIEVKPDILERLSSEEVAGIFVESIEESLMSQVVIISESTQLLEACSTKINCDIGWVEESEDRPSNDLKQKIGYIFMSYKDVKHIHYWKDIGIRVGIYTINDVNQVIEMLDMGADLIETNHFSRILREMG